MKYDVTKWLHNVSLMQHSMASETRMLLADVHQGKAMDEAEIMLIQQWIQDAERIRDEAYAMLANWTELPASDESDA